MEIRMDLQIDKVNKLCAICDACNFDVNVISGRICVDGKSVMGVMKMCGRTVTISPVTLNDDEAEDFFNKIKPLGAYKTEGFYG